VSSSFCKFKLERADGDSGGGLALGVEGEEFLDEPVPVGAVEAVDVMDCESPGACASGAAGGGGEAREGTDSRPGEGGLLAAGCGGWSGTAPAARWLGSVWIFRDEMCRVRAGCLSIPKDSEREGTDGLDNSSSSLSTAERWRPIVCCVSRDLPFGCCQE